MRLLIFGTASTAISTALILNAFHQREYHFYASCLHLGKSPVTILCLLAWTLFIAIFTGRFLQKSLFGELRVIEAENIYDKIWYTIMDMCLAMTIFRNSFDVRFLFLFGSLLYLKIFHWISSDRVDFMDQLPEVDLKFHLKMSSALFLILIFDLIGLSLALDSIFKNGLDMILVFTFELTLLLSSAIVIIGKYIVHTIDMRSENPWEEKSQYIFYIELTMDFIKLLAYGTFFIAVITQFGLPLHIIRDLYITLRSFIMKCRELYQYRQATFNMRDRYPNATLEDLNSTDSTCIICRDEMTLVDPNDQANFGSTPKKLPCGHIFHLRCLKSWLERQQTCPTCRRSVLDVPPVAPAPPIIPATQEKQDYQIKNFKTMEDFLKYSKTITDEFELQELPETYSMDHKFENLGPSKLTIEEREEIAKNPRLVIEKRILEMKQLQKQMNGVVSKLEEIAIELGNPHISNSSGSIKGKEKMIPSDG